MKRHITLLWSLRSPCNLGCPYCYFGTIEEHRVKAPAQAGQLSHLSRADLSVKEVFAFARTLGDSAVGRVFLAGGEPLIWPPLIDLIAVLKAAEIEVVVCTNGIPLNRPDVVDGLLSYGVEAVSVSLDSADPGYNDRWRPSRNGMDGWDQVITGIRALVERRAERVHPRIGLYSVVTRLNIPQVVEVAKLAANLGCDYYVPQPVALERTHRFHDELSLRPEDVVPLREAFAELYESGFSLSLPRSTFPGQVVSTILHETGTVADCFGGHRLRFVQPDGSVWDCPSSLKIAETPQGRRRTIKGRNAAELFPAVAGCGAACGLFSRDCVNMWPLMDAVAISDTSEGPR
ncbi:hypothetical protein GCM10022252_48090 [Streptosporangium oxazolinicum]|uniref:Radical SAM core domain-containing protein n=1 Tax=Streptosporangium oxazolinicum TaxID=909287 RepID=A0ABP8B572_9ACTN